MVCSITRRKRLGCGALGVRATGIGIAGCTYTMTRAVQARAEAPASPPLVSVQISSRIRLHMIQIGWFAMKSEHRADAGAISLRIPVIMASQS